MIVVSGTRAEVVTSHIPCRHARHIPPSRASSPFPVVVTSNPCHTLGMSPCAQDMRRRRGDVWSQTTLDLHIPGRVLVQFDEVRFLRSVETSGRVRDASKVGKARRRPQPTTTSRRICIARPPPLPSLSPYLAINASPARPIYCLLVVFCVGVESAFSSPFSHRCSTSFARFVRRTAAPDKLEAIGRIAAQGEDYVWFRKRY